MNDDERSIKHHTSDGQGRFLFNYKPVTRSVRILAWSGIPVGINVTYMNACWWPRMKDKGRDRAGHLTGPRVRPWTTRWWSESDVGRLQGDTKRGDTPRRVSPALQTLSAICHTRNMQQLIIQLHRQDWWASAESPRCRISFTSSRLYTMYKHHNEFCIAVLCYFLICNVIFKIRPVVLLYTDYKILHTFYFWR